MITTHKFINQYPIKENSEKLILGTIHPHLTENFDVQFFYGNRSSIWKILNSAFEDEIGNPISLTGILNFLDTRKISISDTILSCRRKNPTALDSDLIPESLNHGLIEQIKKSEIKEILFTSGFSTNNAFKLFYTNILGLKITKEIKRNKSAVLDSNIFGRPILLTVLLSPSGSANISLSKSTDYLKWKEKYSTFKTPVQQFKIDFYKQKFANI